MFQERESVHTQSDGVCSRRVGGWEDESAGGWVDELLPRLQLSLRSIKLLHRDKEKRRLEGGVTAPPGIPACRPQTRTDPPLTCAALLL